MLNYVIKGFGNQMAFGAPWLTYRLPRSESLGRMDHGGCFLFISVLVSQCFSSFPFLSSSQKPHCRTLSCGNWLSKREASFFRDLCWTLGTPPLKHPWGSEVGARWCCLLLHMVPPLGLHPPSSSLWSFLLSPASDVFLSHSYPHQDAHSLSLDYLNL